MMLTQSIKDVIRQLENVRNQTATLEGEAEATPSFNDFGVMQIEDAVSDIDAAIAKLKQATQSATREAA